MALEVKVGSFVPASGSQTIDPGFQPVALIVWTSGRTTAGGGSAHGRFGYGFATDRGGTAVQRYVGFASEDAIGTADVYAGAGTGSLLKLTDGTTATVAFNMVFTEFVAGGFTFNVATATLLPIVNYIAFGGTDVVDALVDSLNAATGTNDETVVSGFGQPQLIFFGISWDGTETPITANGDSWFGWGVKAASANGRGIRFGSNDAATTQATNQAIYNNRAVSIADAGAAEDFACQVNPASGWPTDGFEWVRSAGTTINYPVPYMALRFSANVTVTTGEAAASTSLNGTNTLTSADTPKLALVCNARTATANTVDSTSTDCMYAGIGACDGDGNERYAAVYDDDGQGTASVAGTSQSTTKGIEYWVPSSDTKDAEADIAVSGTNFVTTWTDQAPTAFLYEWLTLGVVTAAAAAIPDVVMAPMGTT